MLESNICRSTQLKSAEFQRWMAELGHPPMVMHRKLWEWAYIAQALEENGMLVEGKKGLGFAVGKEPLVAMFAAKGCEIVATDLDELSAADAGWTTTNQHASDLGSLNSQGLCSAEEFRRRVTFRVVDMNEMPDDLSGFDFVWSSCAIEHLGDLNATEDFMSRMMGCLKPGGFAVHTTEYNLSSNTETVERGATVILRKCDLEKIVTRLEVEGHHPRALDLDVGDADDDKVILSPPYEGYPCLKIWIGSHAATSVGLLARAGDADAIRNVREKKIVRTARSVPRRKSFVEGMRAWFEPARIPAPVKLGGLEPKDVNRILQTSTAEELVDSTYRLLLGRAADAEGLAHFSQLISRQGLLAADVASLIIGADEFAIRHGFAQPSAEVQLDGYCLFVRPSDRDIGGAIKKGVSYEPHISALLKRQLSRGDTFLDVGANIGYFTMMAANLVGPQGKVIAIEPMDKNLQLIYLSIEKNHFDNVDVFPFGASESKGMVSIVTDPGTSNALVQSAPSSRNISLRAPTRTIDNMCEDYDRIDFMKIDIEGHEVFAWRGAKDMLARCKPKIATEFHPLAMLENSGVDSREYVEMMFSYSSEIQVIHSAEKTISCATYEQLMAQWQESDKQYGGVGSSHLDLFLLPKS